MPQTSHTMRRRQAGGRSQLTRSSAPQLRRNEYGRQLPRGLRSRLVIFFGVVFFLFWLITTVVRLLGPERSRRTAATALLRERLARGEISPAEYEEARRILGA